MKKYSVRSAATSSKIALAAMLCLTGAAAPAFAQEQAAQETAEVSTQAAEPAAPQAGIPEWGIDNAELPADPSVVYGTLDNGMRYAIKQHASPSNEASIRFLVKVGAREERDDEEGAAHFVEHMAFNGTTNIPEGELLPMLERLGLAFGADTNAETSLEYTMYKLDIPNVDEETLDTSLMILREMTGELTIAADAVEAEKGIILSEYQVRNTPARRRVSQFLRESLETPRVGDRVTAEPVSIQALTAEKLRAFYDGYYRPDRATMAVVGDLDPAQVQEKLEAKFADWQPKGEARERLIAKPADTDELIVSTFVDLALPEIIDMQTVVQYQEPANSGLELQRSLLEQTAAAALTNRINALAKQEGAKTLGGQAIVQDLFQAARAYGLLLVAEDGKWSDALQVAEQEWRRVVEHGFTMSEIDEAKTNIQSNFATGAAQAASAGNASLAEAIAISSLNNSVRQSPEQTLALYNLLAATITPEAVSDAFRAGWGEAPTYLMLASKTEVPEAKAAIAKLLTDSAQVAVTKPTEVETAPFAYENFGEPGEVVFDELIEDLGIRTVRFANGVQLNLKKTDFEMGKISFRAEVGQGSSITPEGFAGVGLLANVLANADGLGAHKIDELRRILAGKQVTIGYALQSDAIALNATANADDALLQLQLMAAQISDPAFSEETQRQWVGAAPIVATTIANSPQQVMSVAHEALLTDGDERLGFTDPAVIIGRSVADLKTVIGQQFANGAIDLAVVGDFDEDTMIAHVAATLGALDRADETEQAVAPLTFTANRETRTLYHTGEADQGMIAISWPTDDAHDLRGSLTRQLLGRLIDQRAIEILREELGATYTPNVQSASSLVFDGFGHLTVMAPADPATMDQVATAIQDIVTAFTAAAPSEDALQRARQPILEGYERQLGRNTGWTGIVVEAQSNPAMLDRRRSREEILRAVTPADILAEAKKYLGADPVEVRVVPSVQAVPAEVGEAIEPG